MLLRRTPFLIFLTASLLGSASLQPAFSQSLQEENSLSMGAITGRVLNENGQPISQATVFVSGPMGVPQQRSTTTNDDGNFLVSGLDPALYFVRAVAPAYVTAPRDPDSPSPSSYRIGDSVNINLIKGGVITGKVTSPSGQPLVQAAVRATLIRDPNGKPPSGPRFQFEKTTDDRGIYRIYGLAAGTYVVSAGGRVSTFNLSAYDADSPTYAPSATRALAAEIEVRAGEETTGVDIRHRGEPGHSISGTVSGSTSQTSPTNITLAQAVNGVSQLSGFSYQLPNSSGFAFYGVADGDYDLIAQSASAEGDQQLSEPLRITVKGKDFSGANLTLNTLPAVSGRVVLETSTTPECKNKRKPLFSETSLMALRSSKQGKEPLVFPNFSGALQTSPGKTGDFVLRNLVPGQFSLNVRFFAKYWYLRRIERNPSVAQAARIANADRQNDLARNGFQLKFGERLNNVTVMLAEGAGSLRGAVKLAGDESVPAKLYVHLVPAEKENTEDVLRFFTTLVQTDGKFSLINVPPGRYWVVARLSANGEPQFDAKLRAPDEADTRLQIRREAEANKTELELKPCQNVVDYNYRLELSRKKLVR